MKNTIINRLAFADDIVFISETKEDIVKMTEEFRKMAEKVGLKISNEKSEYMHCGKKQQ